MNDKEAYEAAVKLTNANRCITCDYYQTDGHVAMCTEYACHIESDLLYKPNDCPKYIREIPF